MALQVINPWSNIIVFEKFAGITCTRAGFISGAFNCLADCENHPSAYFLLKNPPYLPAYLLKN
jgi:hypothetical protein